MKKLILSIVMTWMVVMAQAQIMMTPYVDTTMGGLNENSAQLVENRLRSIISSAGMLSSYNTRFILATQINLLNRETTNGAPTRIIQCLNITLAIGDGESGICYGSTSFEIKGIGETEEESMLSALKNIPKSNIQIKELVATSQARILDYYETNATNILARAKSFEEMQNYDAALAELFAIPQECSAYPAALEAMARISKSSIDLDAAQILAEAQAVWSADPNPGPSAELAMSILSKINTGSKHYPQAQALMKKIESRVKMVTDKIYSDEVAYRKAKLNAYSALEKARLNAARDVAVAYAKNRPRIVYRIHSWW